MNAKIPNESNANSFRDRARRRFMACLPRPLQTEATEVDSVI